MKKEIQYSKENRKDRLLTFIPPGYKIYIYTQLVKWCILEASDARVDCKIYCERYQSSLCLDFGCDRAPAVVFNYTTDAVAVNAPIFVHPHQQNRLPRHAA